MALATTHAPVKKKYHYGPKKKQTDCVTRPIWALAGAVRCIDCGQMHDEGEPGPIWCRCGTTYD